MEINDLRIFQVVAKEKSISKAASKLGYAQSNITMRIKFLENNLNTTLFKRSNKGTILTSQGEKLLKYADKILELVDEVNEEFLTSKIDSKIKIGATQTISASILPKLFNLFYKKNPETSLVLKTEKQEVLLDMLINGDLDGAFVYEENISSRFREIFSFKEEFFLVSSVKIDDVNNLDLPIILNSDSNCPYRKIMQKWLISNSCNPTTIIEFDTLESMINGITNDLGISLLPKSVLPKNNNFFLYNLGDADNLKKLEIKFIINKDMNINNSIKSFINIGNSYINLVH